MLVVHIHHIDPINKGVCLDAKAQDVIVIGRLLEGKYNTERLVAVQGPEVANPAYYKVYQGACIESLISASGLKKEHVRLYGDILTGTRIDRNGHLGLVIIQLP